jgi:hypothetical protein
LLHFHTLIYKVVYLSIESISIISLKGRSVWTKIIRNQTAVDYLFNGEAYDFNFQFENTLPKPIKLYPVRIVSVLSHFISDYRVMNWLLDVFIAQQIKMKQLW